MIKFSIFLLVPFTFHVCVISYHIRVPLVPYTMCSILNSQTFSFSLSIVTMSFRVVAVPVGSTIHYVVGGKFGYMNGNFQLPGTAYAYVKPTEPNKNFAFQECETYALAEHMFSVTDTLLNEMQVIRQELFRQQRLYTNACNRVRHLKARVQKLKQTPDPSVVSANNHCRRAGRTLEECERVSTFKFQKNKN